MEMGKRHLFVGATCSPSLILALGAPLGMMSLAQCPYAQPSLNRLTPATTKYTELMSSPGDPKEI